MDTDKNSNISIQAKIVRQLINIATSDHLIGPGIKKGTFRRRLVEPPWRCPSGYSILEIKTKNFEMEFLDYEFAPDNIVKKVISK